MRIKKRDPLRKRNHHATTLICSRWYGSRVGRNAARCTDYPSGHRRSVTLSERIWGPARPRYTNYRSRFYRPGARSGRFRLSTDCQLEHGHIFLCGHGSNCESGVKNPLHVWRPGQVSTCLSGLSWWRSSAGRPALAEPLFDVHESGWIKNDPARNPVRYEGSAQIRHP